MPYNYPVVLPLLGKCLQTPRALFLTHIHPLKYYLQQISNCYHSNTLFMYCVSALRSCINLSISRWLDSSAQIQAHSQMASGFWELPEDHATILHHGEHHTRVHTRTHTHHLCVNFFWLLSAPEESTEDDGSAEPAGWKHGVRPELQRCLIPEETQSAGNFSKYPNSCHSVVWYCVLSVLSD